MKRLLIALLLVAALVGCIGEVGPITQITNEEQAEAANEDVLEDISSLQEDLEDIDGIINE